MALCHVEPASELLLGQVPVIAPLGDIGATKLGSGWNWGSFRDSCHPGIRQTHHTKSHFAGVIKITCGDYHHGLYGGMARPQKTHPLYQWRMQNGHKPLQALAELVGCTQSHLSEIENWKNEPSLDLAARLHRETKIPMEAFVKRSEAAQ
jgi:DNA-binding XRE family transcriptional regulator